MDKKRLNKKAMELLGNHTVNIIIALLCVIVLVYAGVKIYGSGSSSDLSVAESNVQNFAAEFDSFMKSDDSQKEFALTGPKDWYIMFFERSMPNKCQDFKSCVCICEKNLFGSCDEKGACMKLDYGFGNRQQNINKVPFFISINKNDVKKG